MAEVVVVGAGLGGMAVAARLAKQRHHVTLLERNARPGGAINRIEKDGFAWDGGPSSTALPALLRDLFRKSGRPLERYVELVHRDIARRHLFPDGAVVDLPTGSRAAQIDAVDAGLGRGAGQQWAEFVDAQADVWEIFRREVLDDPRGGGRLADRPVAKALRSATSLEKLLKRGLRDTRLRQMVSHHFEQMGSHPRDVPAYGAVQAYVERSFGVWGATDGMSVVTDALVRRLAERDVELRCACPVISIDVAGGQVRGVEVAGGERIAADVVITDLDPRLVFGQMLPKRVAAEAARVFDAATPAVPPSVTHLGVTGTVPELPAETVLHGDPLMLLTTDAQAPEGSHAWTVQRRGDAAEDVLLSLARRGIDVRDQVVSRVDRSAVDIVTETGGSPYGIAWDGWRAVARRAAHINPVVGLYLVGASTHPGSTIPYVAWGAAHVAQLVDLAWVSPARR
jgi:phytoene desaturase